MSSRHVIPVGLPLVFARSKLSTIFQSVFVRYLNFKKYLNVSKLSLFALISLYLFNIVSTKSFDLFKKI